MGHLNIEAIATVITMLLGFLFQSLYLSGRYSEKIASNAREIDDLKKNLKDHKSEVRYNDTCDAKHSAIDQRLDRLERLQNGKN